MKVGALSRCGKIYFLVSDRQELNNQAVAEEGIRAVWLGVRKGTLRGRQKKEKAFFRDVKSRVSRDISFSSGCHEQLRIHNRVHQRLLASVGVHQMEQLRQADIRVIRVSFSGAESPGWYAATARSVIFSAAR